MGVNRPVKVNKTDVGKIVTGYHQVREERAYDMFGQQHVFTYYKAVYRDTQEAQRIKDKINSEKAKLNGSNEPKFSTEFIPNEEGDVRIHRVYEQLTDGTKFDYSTKNYLSAFNAEYYRKALDLIAGNVISNPIAGFFTGLVLDDLNKALQGKGDAFSYQRLVYQYGQVYHFGSFRDYYETYQREWYWKHEQISYYGDNTIKSATTAYYLPDSAGYMPFDWIYTGDFYNDTAIMDVALIQYQNNPNATSPARDYFRHEGYRANWKTLGSISY
ncbi:hypothetical protein OS242_09585 [Tumebacillus sp. DT12]|uniref:Bacterial toxin 44 domain-containing protein n=1 Tax=Tumebacillus lacus TaxID=2995335 RepID=A0ABT3WZY2_9BACL|nr:hypothetical protein [Tumebacillus lacus]MCX7570212.1 hypothetical protein [Tumebacillus lacus]